MTIDKRMSYEMQGGKKPARNYLGKQKTVSNVPVKWKSGPDTPETELAYITKAEKDLFLSGDLVIEKGKAPLKPVYLKKINDKCVELTLYEGKYHQIKKMFLKCHNKVVSLKRLKIGELSINEIKTGDWKMLNQKDVDLIFRRSNEK